MQFAFMFPSTSASTTIAKQNKFFSWLRLVLRFCGLSCDFVSKLFSLHFVKKKFHLLLAKSFPSWEKQVHSFNGLNHKMSTDGKSKTIAFISK